MFKTILYYSIAIPVADMRKEPWRESELISQAYFSEEISLLEKTNGWARIVTSDGYLGWLEEKALCQAENPFFLPNDPLAIVKRPAAHCYAIADTIYGPLMTLPFESRLKISKAPLSSTERWIEVLLVDGRQAYIQSGDVALDSKVLSTQEMLALSLSFLGLPYTWGGRSSFGYDCSGFVQMLYRQRKIFLPRDSQDQRHWEGFVPAPLNILAGGDLLFFGLSESQIRHVGLCLDSKRFIHATVAENAPYIRISQLSDPEWNGSGRLPYRTACRL